MKVILLKTESILCHPLAAEHVHVLEHQNLSDELSLDLKLLSLVIVEYDAKFQI